MKEVKISAPAKINLFLEVNGRLPNGYHTISSIMQTVSLCDTVYIKKKSEPGIQLKTNRVYLPCDNRNLAYVAAQKFIDCVGEREIGGVSVYLRKNIPVSAGLAGGSADAAAVLKGMNRLYGFPVQDEKLIEIAAGLGADVPFCMTGGTMLAQGIGEKLTPAFGMPDCYIVIVIGKEMRKSTAQAYAELDALDYEPVGHSGISEALRSGKTESVCSCLHNRFEDISPHISEIRNKMTEYGAAGSLLSGSGPSAFGIFESRLDAERAVIKFRENGYYAWNCHPLK